MYPGAKSYLMPLLLLWMFIQPFYSSAAVYWPGTSRGGQGRRHFNLSELPGIRQRPLRTEKVNINGQDLELEIYQLKTTRQVLLNTISSRFKAEKMELGKDYLRVVMKNGENSYERWIFLFAGDKHPVTGFRIEQDSKILRPSKWPADLPPLPANTRANMVMELPRLKAVYGSFDNISSSPEQLLVSYTARLAGAGWSHAGAEHSPAIRGTGEIYFKNHPVKQVLWIKFGNNGCGAFYLKQIK